MEGDSIECVQFGSEAGGEPPEDGYLDIMAGRYWIREVHMVLFEAVVQEVQKEFGNQGKQK